MYFSICLPIALYIFAVKTFCECLSAMCKYVASDVAIKITTDVVQILGGYGCLKSGNLERTMRDVRMTQIAEGKIRNLFAQLSR